VKIRFLAKSGPGERKKKKEKERKKEGKAVASD